MEYTLHHPDAEILVKDTGTNKKEIKCKLKNNNVFMPTSNCETTYPIDLIEEILDVKGPECLCDEIKRDELPEYVERSIHDAVFCYVNKEQFKHTRVLDFGCGCGASTMVLSRMLPDTIIIGVELESNLLKIAELRANHYKKGDGVRFYLSPDGNSLPEDIGDFDFIFLSAVYEHLLPQERQVVLPLLWSHLKPKGVLFLNQTPYRWFPIESHTTGLIFINYMPDFIASFYARRFSKRKLGKDDWSTLLRKGIRGGSVGEIFKILKNHSSPPILLTPSQPGLKDRIDLWYAISSKSRYPIIRKFAFHLFKLIKISTGQIFLPGLSLAIEKPKDA